MENPLDLPPPAQRYELTQSSYRHATPSLKESPTGNVVHWTEYSAMKRAAEANISRVAELEQALKQSSETV